MANWKKPIHPGEILAEELKEIGLNPLQLAERLFVPDNRIYHILDGKRGITADTALRLGRFFETGPEFWQNLQKAYELAKAYEKAGQGIKKIKPWKKPRKKKPKQAALEF